MCGLSSGYRRFCSRWWKHHLDPRTYLHLAVFAWQRVTRGWADCDTFSLDNHLATVLAASIGHLRDVTVSHPHGMTREKWQGILSKMVAGFEAHNCEAAWPETVQSKVAEMIRTEQEAEGMELFRKWFVNLWS